MKIAQALREKNIAEYLIYMWQVEDLIRAEGCDMDKLKRDVIARFPEAERPALERWYGDLAEMMRAEGVKESGHLQINRNVVAGLTELHRALLASSKYPFYHAAYFKALPFIVELRQKNKGKAAARPEIDTSFDALYGVLLLRLEKKQISPETERAVEAISNFLSLLANYYGKRRRGELDMETDDAPL